MRMFSPPPDQPTSGLPNEEPSTQSVARRGALAFLVFWLVVMAVLYLGMQHYLKPSKPTVLANGSLSIPRAKDGHFRVPGSINGQKVQFLVDTGASMVSVTDALAERAGLTGGVPTTFRTANGERAGRVVRADEVRVGSLAVSQVRVGTGYTGDDDDDALLGQAFLRYFDVQIRGDGLILQTRKDS